MKKTIGELYNKVYDSFIDLVIGKIDKVILTPNEIKRLDYTMPSYKTVIDNDGNFVCRYVDGRHYNYSYTLREHFGDKLVQEIDISTGNYIFRKGSVVN